MLYGEIALKNTHYYYYYIKSFFLQNSFQIGVKRSIVEIDESLFARRKK